jgi:hypothetical protein
VPTHIEPQSGTRREALQIPHSRLAPTATNPYRQGEGGTNTYLQGTAPPPPAPPQATAPTVVSAERLSSTAESSGGDGGDVFMVPPFSVACVRVIRRQVFS